MSYSGTHLRQVDIIHEAEQPLISLGHVGPAMFPF